MTFLDGKHRTFVHIGETLFGAAAYVGFNEDYELHDNYFLCDGTADQVQIQLAIVYVAALGGGGVIQLELGVFTIDATINMNEPSITLRGSSPWNGVAPLAGPVTTGITLANNSDTIMIHVTAVKCTIEYVFLDGNRSNQASGHGIHVDSGGSGDQRILNVYVVDVIQKGILWEASNGISYDTYVEQVGEQGWKIVGSRNSFFGVSAWSCDSFGFEVTGSQNSFTNARSSANLMGYVDEGSFNVFTGVQAWTSEREGIWLLTAQNGILSDCIILDSSASSINGFDGILIGDNVDNYLIENCQIVSTDMRYGIFESATGTSGNKIKNVKISGAVTAPVSLDTATGSVAPFQFTEAVNGAIVTASPTGVDVDAVGEEAIAWGQIPREIQQVFRINIWAVATAGPIDTPGQMHLEVTFNAGASNDAYNTANKSWNITDFDGEETDYVADDVVHWIIENGDVGDELLNLVAGDSFEIKAIGEGGADPDGATDARFRVIEIEYV